MSELDLAVLADGMMSVKEAASFTRLSVAHLCKLISEGRLYSLKHGHRRLVPVRALKEMLLREHELAAAGK